MNEKTIHLIDRKCKCTMLIKKHYEIDFKALLNNHSDFASEFLNKKLSSFKQIKKEKSYMVSDHVQL